MSAFTLDRWIRDRARNTPARVAVDFAGAETTYAQLDRRSDELAASLSHGDVVSTLTGNSVEQIALFFGCAKAGAILHPISWRLAPAEVAYQIEDAGSSFLLATDEHRVLAEAALALAAAAPATELATRAGPAQVPADEDGLLLIYTSGTTGKPKGALLTHANCFWTNLSFDLATGIGGDDVALAFLPQFHVGGWNVQPLLSWWKGARIVLEPAFDPKRALELIGEKRITTLMGVPANYLFMAREPSFASADLELAAACRCGRRVDARATDRGVARARRRDRSGLRAHRGIAERALPSARERKVAKSAPRASRIRSSTSELSAQGRAARAGAERVPRLLAQPRGDGFHDARGRMAAYRPTSASEMRRDTSGSRAGSRRCSSPAARTSTPRRSRRCSTSMPLCTDVAVVGVPDEMWGEVGVAFVVPGGTLDARTSVVHFCRERLARFKVPKRVPCSSMSCRATRWGRSRRTSCCRCIAVTDAVVTNVDGRPLSRRGLDTRRRLLDAAEHVFGELGYHEALGREAG